MRRTAFIILLLLPFLASSQSTFLLHRADPGRPMYFNRLGRAQGMPAANASCAVQDHDGFLWIGTDNGLVRYDGHSVLLLQHDPANPASLADNSVYTLALGPDSLLWVGTSNGLSILDPSTLLAKSFPLKTSFFGSQKVRCFRFDDDGTAWIGTFNGIFRLGPRDSQPSHCLGTVKDHTFSRESKLNEINFLIPDPRDPEHMLVGTNGGLVLFDRNTRRILRDYHHRLPPAAEQRYGAFSGFLDDSLRLWTHGWLTGINILDLRNEQWTDLLPFSDTLAIALMLTGERGELWLGTLNKGVVRVNTRDLTYSCYRGSPDRIKALASDYANFLLRDRDGNLWVLGDGGVSIEDKRFRSFHRHDLPLPHSWVSAFWHDDRNGRLYTGTYDGNGLYYRDDAAGTWHTIPTDPPVPRGNFCINTLYTDSRGVLWAGTRTSLYFLDPAGRLRLFRTPDGLPLPMQDPVVYALYEDRLGNLWVGTRLDGVFRIAPGRTEFTHFVHQDSDPSSLIAGSHIRGIHEDHSGKVWIGSMQGFCTFDPATGRFSTAAMEQAVAKGIVQRLVYTIDMDTLGRMWLTSDRQGLLRIETTVSGQYDFRLFTTRQGLNDPVLLYFSQDPDGNFWIVNNGLVCMNPYTETFRTFTTLNGLYGLPDGDVKTYADSRGTVYVGDDHGFETIGRREAASDNGFFALVLEGIDVNGLPCRDFSRKGKTGRYRFSPDDRNLTFRYTAVNYTAPEQVTFQYFLEGFDPGWSRPGQGRETRYTNLPPGNYTFHVRALAGRPVREAAVSFRIPPKFYNTWWFILLCLVLVQAVAFAIFRYRRNQLIRMERLRARIASDLHDDVSSTLSSISIISSLLARRTREPQDSELIGEISSSARGLLERTDDIIWSVNPKNDSFQDLGLRLREYAIPLFESTGISFHIELPESLNAVKIPMDVRRSLYLIAKEAVNNLVKYSGCTEAQIRFSYERSHICLYVKDNGQGFDPLKPTSRNGIRNMRHRAERIGARFTLESAPGQGTAIRVERKIR